MQETLHFSCPSFIPTLSKPLPSSPKYPSSLSPKSHLHPILSSSSSLRSPPTPTPTLTQTPPKSPTFLPEKLLFLDSIGLDHLSLIQSHPSILSSSLSDLQSTVHFLRHVVHLTSPDLRRTLSMCPQILTSHPQTLAAVVAFLLREAAVDARRLRRVIHRRPRLLVSDVATRLRPTLYFLQMLGISDVSNHTYLLSCSVEDKLIPRLDFFRSSGFSDKDARAMVRRLPQLFCYGIDGNLKVKLGFLVEEMGRGLEEARDFPQYFSYSLERRIKKRHSVCKEKGVLFTLPALLRPNDEEFRQRVEVCIGSTPPLRDSPLWYGIRA